MRTSLIRAAVPLRASYLRSPPTTSFNQPHVQQSLQSQPQLSQYFFPKKTFSTNHHLHVQNSSPSKPPLPPNPSFGAASFKELGATRTVEVVVYIAIGIMGTVETFTWSKFLWAKFGPKDVEIEARPEK
ncbi:hypothetical protein ONS96_008306 [Cadophora gregata f. sp. sojae]|nr:hypothetical protein ONS96_008306 [Cadophora gregata f. sp. sojae]